MMALSEELATMKHIQFTRYEGFKRLLVSVALPRLVWAVLFLSIRIVGSNPTQDAVVLTTITITIVDIIHYFN
jgi:hypothetical protein